MYELLRSEGRNLNAVVEIFEPPIERSLSGGTFHGETRLNGLAIVVKDMVAISGHRRGNGNPNDALSAPIETTNAPVIDSLLNAGVKIVATTSLLEYAAGAQHPDIPETRNPLNPELTAGGSSAGSAALVGAKIIPLAIGTDTGGSIRIPAAYCGVIGFKPTTGLIPLTGITPLAPTYDHCGFIAAEIDDVKDALVVTSQQQLIEQNLKEKIRLGVPSTLINDPRNDSRIIARFKEVEKVLATSGFEILEIDSELLEDFRSAFIDVVLFEAWEIYGERVKSSPDHFGPETLRLFLLGESISRESYEQALAIRTKALAGLTTYMESIDALMMPTVPYFAPETTPPIDSELGSYESLYTEIFNVSGQPAITLPASCNPMPIGIQLVGSLNSDLTLLEISKRVLPHLQ